MSCGVAQVGDPGEHPLFTGVALKRATRDESDEDAAAGELMLEQARMYAKKLKRVLEPSQRALRTVAVRRM